MGRRRKSDISLLNLAAPVCLVLLLLCAAAIFFNELELKAHTAEWNQPVSRVNVIFDFYKDRRTGLLIGLCLLILANAALWTALIRRRFRDRRRTRRFGHGLCQSCGYNLTGVVSMRCPECGAAYPGPIPRIEP